MFLFARTFGLRENIGKFMRFRREKLIIDTRATTNINTRRDKREKKKRFDEKLFNPKSNSHQSRRVPPPLELLSTAVVRWSSKRANCFFFLFLYIFTLFAVWLFLETDFFVTNFTLDGGGVFVILLLSKRWKKHKKKKIIIIVRFRRTNDSLRLARS